MVDEILLVAFAAIAVALTGMLVVQLQAGSTLNGVRRLACSVLGLVSMALLLSVTSVVVGTGPTFKLFTFFIWTLGSGAMHFGRCQRTQKLSGSRH